MISTQSPFLAPCLQSSNKFNLDPDLGYNLDHSMLPKTPKSSAPSCVNLRFTRW